MKKIFGFIIILILIGALVFGFLYYKKYFAPNITETTLIYIPDNVDYQEVKKLIAPYVKNMESFDRAAESAGYTQKIKAGRFKISEGEGNREVIRRLLIGNQEEVHLRIKAYDNLYQLASDLGKNMECDSAAFIRFFIDKAEKKGFSDVEELKIYFTPDTYFVNWNTSPEQLFARFEKIHNDFWTEERKQKAQKLGLTPLQVYILASIVQREYQQKDELPIIASLYLNRLRQDIKLKSDPTVIYAEKKAQGFHIQRKRVKDVSIDSPYNTYKYKGLPPLPICIPESLAVDAVLNPAETDYLYMCAVRNTGRHLFTADAAEHMKNAKAYRDWLDSINIK